MNTSSINSLKDILYLVGSFLGIIGFIRTLKKREYSGFNYRTDFGNEVEPFLICLRGSIYNLSVSNNERSVFVHKYTSDITPSRKGIESNIHSSEKSAYFPVIKEGEFLRIENHDLKMNDLFLKYEDKYQNHYFQIFSFDDSEIGNPERIKRTSRSCYKLTQRKYKFMYVWFPLISRFIKI